jgi:hypothetical protein
VASPANQKASFLSFRRAKPIGAIRPIQPDKLATATSTRQPIFRDYFSNMGCMNFTNRPGPRSHWRLADDGAKAILNHANISRTYVD